MRRLENIPYYVKSICILKKINNIPLICLLKSSDASLLKVSSKTTKTKQIDYILSKCHAKSMVPITQTSKSALPFNDDD